MVGRRVRWFVPARERGSEEVIKYANLVPTPERGNKIQLNSFQLRNHITGTLGPGFAAGSITLSFS
jgi:hypothetical protein